MWLFLVLLHFWLSVLLGGGETELSEDREEVEYHGPNEDGMLLCGQCSIQSTGRLAILISVKHCVLFRWNWNGWPGYPLIVQDSWELCHIKNFNEIELYNPGLPGTPLIYNSCWPKVLSGPGDSQLLVTKYILLEKEKSLIREMRNLKATLPRNFKHQSRHQCSSKPRRWSSIDPTIENHSKYVSIYCVFHSALHVASRCLSRRYWRLHRHSGSSTK